MQWQVPSLRSPTPIKFVQPKLRADIRGLRGSIADSTGGNVYNDLGGELRFPDGQTIKLPKANDIGVPESTAWMIEQLARIPNLVNKNPPSRARKLNEPFTEAMMYEISLYF